MKRHGHIVDRITLADIRREVVKLASANRYRRATMKEDLRRIIKDPTALKLIDRIVDMGDQGIAIGNTASHFFANLYLTPVVEQLSKLKGVSTVVVYMDNVLVFGRSKRNLHAARKEAEALLAVRGLTMKGDWQVFRTDRRAVKIGGFCVQAYRPWRIYHATFRHLHRVARQFIRANARRSPSALHFARSFASLKGWIECAGRRSFTTQHINKLWPVARKVIQNADACL